MSDFCEMFERLQKRKRTVDKELLALIRHQRCIVCFETGQEQCYPTEADHITSRGAGGGDTDDNVWPLCTAHHKERHMKGIGHMIRTYASCRTWLNTVGRDDILLAYP